MVVGDLGADVVKDVSLRDAVSQESTEPTEEGTCTAEEGAIESGKSAALAVEIK
jgi:hypothetical protein